MEALEADFLQDLYKLRQLKAETSQALHKVRLLSTSHQFVGQFLQPVFSVV